MIRTMMLTLIALAATFVLTSPTQAQTYFEWTSGQNAGEIVTWMSPDVYQRFLSQGLVASTGTVTTPPWVFLNLAGPGPRQLRLGNHTYWYLHLNGQAEQGNTKLYVVTLTPDLTGTWKSRHWQGATLTLVKTANGYAYHNFQGCNAELFFEGTTLRIRWWGALNGETRSTSYTSTEIRWGNDTWYR
jgi:hypothetical protein